MEHTPLTAIPEPLPDALQALIQSSRIYDSSCGNLARVYYLQSGPGFYLKIAEKDSLREEVELTRYFHRKGLAPEVLLYESQVRDYLLTRRILGQDCIHEDYLRQPEKLCDVLGQCLRMLHSVSASDCPVVRTGKLLRQAETSYRAGHFHTSVSIPGCQFASAEEAWSVLRACGSHLHSDTLIHGDFCLPNILLDDWKFAGFIDVGGGGLGDRHMDLFWCIWSLGYNLKTHRYTERLLDAYGREDFSPDLLRAVAALEALG